MTDDRLLSIPPPSGRRRDSSDLLPGLCLATTVVGILLALVLTWARSTAGSDGMEMQYRSAPMRGEASARRIGLNDPSPSAVSVSGTAPVQMVSRRDEESSAGWKDWADLAGDRKAGNENPDADLVRAVRKGDEVAFEVLVRRHLPAVHRLAMSIVKDSDEADDVCQDAFLSVLRRIEQLRDDGSFRSWLLSIVRNRSLNHLAREARRAAAPVDEIPEPANRGQPERQVERLELEDALETALDELTKTQKSVFVLHDIDGMDHGEVAASLGISRGSSRVHLHMARRAMRTRLDRSYFEEA
jgi:RNA polymerase sigma-70 factor (ECF subfamily)